MSVLFDKEVEEVEDVKQPSKPFTIVLEKYKAPVIITSLLVDDHDDTLLNIEFDHDIDAPQNEVSEELGRVLLAMLEESVKLFSNDLKVEIEK